MAKYSDTFNRDFEFYERHIGKLTYIGAPLPDFVQDRNGADAKKAFLAYDAQGKIIPTCEVEKILGIIAFKKALNFHLKMWAEGYSDMFMGVHEYMEEFDNPPEWVEKSFRNQIAKFHFEDK